MATATLLEYKRFDRLSYWFIAHGIVDLLFAVPMLVVPEAFLKALGWHVVDPVVARVVAAALIGIGGESLIAMRAEFHAVKSMLELKILWSIAAIIGLVVSATMADALPWGVWPIGGIFIVFSAVWIVWRIRISGLAGR